MQLLLDSTKERGARREAADVTPEVCAQGLLDTLPSVMWFIRRHMRQHPTAGLSVPQYRTMVMLERFPRASLSAVAENVGTCLPTASRLVQGLVTKGLVVRKPSTDDRRQVQLLLTARGQKLLKVAHESNREIVAEQVARLGPTDRAAVLAAMNALQDVFDNTPPPSDTLPVDEPVGCED